jgi:DNA repair exonuclease SbcCD ATPase subunit
MNKIYFFNSANFNFAKINLKNRNVFFIGDNGSGKTTAIRAIHFYYNSDVRGVGIDANKDSFKDFYFKNDNSFIVYEFDDYFILMYKRRNEIKKLFSKQKFEIERIKIDNKIKPIEDIIKYVKEASLWYIPQTNEEYKKIIYGFDRKHLDFKLSTIKNYNTFINLYNKIFNVNKAVFDAKSIKEIIFTTLNENEFREINYEEFLNGIYEAKRYFLFNKKFKSVENKIDELYNIKNSLILLKQEIEILLKKILFKKEIEKEKLEELIQEIKNLSDSINKKENKIKNIEKEKEQFLENINNSIYKLKSQISEINILKVKFTLIKLEEAKNRVLKKEEVDKKIIELEISKNELIKGIKTQIDEIEDNIKNLKREKRNLKDELRSEEIKLKRFLDEIYEEKIQKLQAEIVKKEKNFYKNIATFEEKIDNLLLQKESFQKKINRISYKYKELENKIKNEIEQEEIELENQKREIKNRKDILINENYNLNKKLQKEKDELNEKIEKTEATYNKEIEDLKNLVLFYKNILKTKENSFKYFLTQFVENWEEELYPIIDESLLNMDIDTLKPKITSEKVIGISFDKTNLKSIPTMQQAEKEIEKLTKTIEILENEKLEKIEILNKEYKEKEIKISSQIDTNSELIKQKETHFKELNEKIDKLITKLKNRLYKLNKEKRDEENIIKNEISKIEELIKNLNNKINKEREKIKNNQKEFENSKKELLKEKEVEFNQKKENLKLEFKEKENKLDKKIDELQNNKEKISKDERIKEIESEIIKLKKEKKEIESAELFLNEYNLKKEFINSLSNIKNELEKKIEQKEKKEKEFKNSFRNLKNEIEKVDNNIKILEQEKRILKEGLEESLKIEIEVDEKIKTDNYLIYLIKEYKEKKDSFEKNQNKIQNIANKITNTLKNFVIEGLDVNFNVEKLSEMVDEEFERVDELYEFKNKKINFINKTKYRQIKMLLDELLDKKIDGFERNRDDFIKQVRKINSNLSKVDFGIVKNIKIEIEENKKNILKIFEKIKDNISELMTIGINETLFFDEDSTKRILDKIEGYFNTIKKEISRDNFSLIDVIDIKVNFVENEKMHTLKEIRNESSTGGSILLKIAIAVSLLELFIKEKADLFLILDEVGVISTKNQQILKDFVNKRGLGVIYIAPNLPYIELNKNISIYKFRNINGTFETIQMIADNGINFK